MSVHISRHQPTLVNYIIVFCGAGLAIIGIVTLAVMAAG